MKIIQVMGAPGSGKGTQAALLEKKFGLKYIGSGDLLRERASKKDFTGEKIKKTMNRGERVATPVIFNIWMNKMELFKKNKESKGFVLDGSPRSLEEARMLDEALEWYGWKKSRRVVFIDISDKESKDRLTKRRMCAKCGQIIPYIGEFKKLKKCNKCGGKLEQRLDDSIKSIKERLKWFKSDVVPAVNYYRRKNELMRIDGEQPIEKVFGDILKKLKW